MIIRKGTSCIACRNLFDIDLSKFRFVEQRNRGKGTYLLSDFGREAKANGAYMVIIDALDFQKLL